MCHKSNISAGHESSISAAAFVVTVRNYSVALPRQQFHRNGDSKLFAHAATG
jgi:hypothetical protein